MPNTLDPAMIEALIRAVVGNAFSQNRLEPVAGGSIHPAYCAHGSNARYFIKTGAVQDLDMFEAEADGLAALKATDTFRIPECAGSASNETVAILALEFLDLKPLEDTADCRQAGHQLAALHRHHGTQFGWRRPNYLGRTPHDNTGSTHWPEFLKTRRFAPLFQRADVLGFNDLLTPGRQLLSRLDALLVDTRPSPSLVHGDLWHGNVGVSADGQIAVFDPAVCYGDAAFDLALTRLFGGFHDMFFVGYNEASGEREPSPTIASLYRLYHVLNHLILFGRPYLGESLRLTRNILKSA